MAAQTPPPRQLTEAPSSALRFVHHQDPEAHITCELRGTMDAFLGHDALPIVRCMVSGTGAMPAQEAIVRGIYRTADLALELDCDSTTDRTCSLRRAGLSADPLFSKGMMVVSECEPICRAQFGLIDPADRGDILPEGPPAASQPGRSALTSADPLLRDSAASALAGAAPRGPLGQAAPVCMQAFLNRGTRIPIFAPGSA